MVTQKFLLAGNAIFTVTSSRTGKHYTYNVTRPKDFNELSPVWFVHLLCGPDNTKDYIYIGLIGKDGTLRNTKKSGVDKEAQSFEVGRWVIQHIWNGLDKSPLPKWVELNHCGYCGRCGKLLTTPESVENGFGPECIKKVGL